MKNQRANPLINPRSTERAPRPSTKKASLFCVSVREKGRPYYDVLVVALTIRDARRLGVNACEAEGLINRTQINDTLIFKIETEVFQ